jgi:hypothetical protein
MRPWQHAKSSAHHFNGSWQNDLPIHEFLDMTKFAVADLRHRIILHNIDLGPRLAAAAFPNHPNAWSVARRHVEEDMRCTPSLADWLSHCDLSLLPAPRHSSFAREEVVDMLTRRQKLGSSEGPTAVVDLLLLPMEMAPDFGARALAILCNSIGPLIVRRVLGPPRAVPGAASGTKVFDPAWAAEAAIVWLMGRRIPPFAEIVDAVREFPTLVEEAE